MGARTDLNDCNQNSHLRYFPISGPHSGSKTFLNDCNRNRVLSPMSFYKFEQLGLVLHPLLKQWRDIHYGGTFSIVDIPAMSASPAHTLLRIDRDQLDRLPWNNLTWSPGWTAVKDPESLMPCSPAPNQVRSSFLDSPKQGP